MKQDCLDIGLIQAFLDGELSLPERTVVSSHVALCEDCAFMLAEAEDEAAIVFPVLEREFNTLVPTQRLWTRINSAIEIEKRETPFWQKAWAAVSAAFANPSFAAAAGLLIVVGIFASVWMNRTPASSDTIASAPKTMDSTTSAPSPVSTSSVPDGIFESRPSVQIERAADRSEPVRAQRAVYRGPNLSNGYMPGEESYVKTISRLSETVDEKKDGILRPAQRVAFERDLAVVNDAIGKVKNEVKRNPRNETARQMLYASYQNKIDLLNSVAQKEEFVASIR